MHDRHIGLNCLKHMSKPLSVLASLSTSSLFVISKLPKKMRIQGQTKIEARRYQHEPRACPRAEEGCSHVHQLVQEQTVALVGNYCSSSHVVRDKRSSIAMSSVRTISIAEDNYHTSSPVFCQNIYRATFQPHQLRQPGALNYCTCGLFLSTSTIAFQHPPLVKCTRYQFNAMHP